MAWQFGQSCLLTGHQTSAVISGQGRAAGTPLTIKGTSQQQALQSSQPQFLVCEMQRWVLRQPPLGGLMAENEMFG